MSDFKLKVGHSDLYFIMLVTEQTKKEKTDYTTLDGYLQWDLNPGCCDDKQIHNFTISMSDKLLH